jgi:vitamin B12 transporter
METKHRLWLALLCAGLSCYPQQQTDSTRVRQLQEVVVTDSRFPLKREQSGKTVIRLGPEELREYQGASVAQLLNQQAGFEVSGSRGRPGEVLGVFARGGRGRQVLVLIDGLRVSDPSSFAQEYDLRLLPVSALESVEIVKGASSVLYGANAATAVIDIRTRRAGNTPVQGRVQGSMGTQNPVGATRPDVGKLNHYAEVGGRQEGWDYKAAFSHSFANGLSSLEGGVEEDPYSNWSADLSAGRQLGRHSRLGVLANRTRMRAAYDDAFNGVDAPFSFRTQQQRLGIQWLWKDSLQQLEVNGAFTEYRSENESDFPGVFEGESWTGDLVYKRRLAPQLHGLVGLNVLLDRARLEAREQFSLVDPYLNLVWTGKGGGNLNAGLRLNSHSTYGTRGVYHLNPSYSHRIKGGYLKAMGSWATAYITPSLTQLFGAFGANPNLEPETNRTLEGGLELALDRGVRLSVLYYNRSEENTVLFNNADFVYFNSSEAVAVRGLEGELDWEWSAGARLQVNYAFTEREGGEAIRIPRHKLNLTARAPISKRASALFRYGYTGMRTDTDFTTFTPVELPGFSLVDVRVDYQICPGRLEGFLQVSNLLGESYTEVLGFATPGRNFQVGWSLKL